MMVFNDCVSVPRLTFRIRFPEPHYDIDRLIDLLACRNVCVALQTTTIIIKHRRSSCIADRILQNLHAPLQENVLFLSNWS